mgnify:CR=1 FL=1
MIKRQVILGLVLLMLSWHFTNEYLWTCPSFPNDWSLESCADYYFYIGFFLFFVLMSGLILVALAGMIVVLFNMLTGKD